MSPPWDSSKTMADEREAFSLHHTAPAPEVMMGSREGVVEAKASIAEWRPGGSGLVQETHVWLPAVLCQGLRGHTCT